MNKETKRLIYYSLWVAYSLGNLIALSIGIATRNGDFVAMGSLMAGLMLSIFFWLYTLDELPTLSPKLRIVRWIFIIYAGLALYSNLSWFLWMLDIPVSIGTVATGHMAENYWLGPFTLIFAALAYYYYQSER